MGYMHIQNLYKEIDVLQEGKFVWVLEKIHGSSANVSFRDGQLKFFSGGVKHDPFVALFDQASLLAKFTELSELHKLTSIKVYGEAYGGACQRMKDTYGEDLKFVAFDVEANDKWLNVPDAVAVVKHLGLEFVDYALVPSTIEAMNKERDMPSVQAFRNIGAKDKIREGIVIRPEFEVIKASGKRVMAKHKRAEFGETKTPREVNPNELKVLEEANAIAEEWVTAMRLEHVLDKLDPPATAMEDTKRVIVGMIADVRREGEGEMVWSNEVASAISRATAKLFKSKITQVNMNFISKGV